ncbi:MAG: DUF2029 domain-containing protein [Chloroflexi bacterium]|nr:DUF2029 domain-containing protein [Chloroflexota bacterium]
MLFDFRVFYAAGRAVLAGASPYGVAAFYYPLPVAYFFALLGLLPFEPALGLWWALQLAALIAVARRATGFWLFFPPVIQLFLSGNMDLLMLGLLRLAWGGSAAALALSSLKPQLGLLLTPYLLWRWRRDRRKLAIFAGTLALVYSPFFALRPGWVGEWLAHRRPLWEAMSRAPTVFGLVGSGRGWVWAALALAAGLGVWSWRVGSWRALLIGGLAANPVIHPYDFALLAEPALRWRTWLAGWIGWLAFLVSGDFRWGAVVPLAALWDLHRERGDDGT